MLANNESVILAGLLRDEDYFRKVIPFIKSEYFESDVNRTLFKFIKNYTNKYKVQPTKTVLEKSITHLMSAQKQEIIDETAEKLHHICKMELPNSTEYMFDETESFCRYRAITLAIYKTIALHEDEDNKNREQLVNSIPDILKDALAVSFDTSVGHDYNNDEEARWEYYNKPENKIAFEMDYMNEITGGGVSRKTLNVLAAGVNVGKTMLLVYLAAMYKRMGYNVLYITNEINEMELAQRIDASTLNIETDMILSIGKEKYMNKFQKLRESAQGRLFVKEFPTGTCTASGTKRVLRELELKKKFKPDIIINDYLTINAADNMVYNGNTSTYFEKVAEEMRALAMEENVVMWTAAQFNKDGVNSSDPSMTDIGSSLGISKVADLIWAVIRSEQLDILGQLFMKQLKTRYHKIKNRDWNVGVSIGTQRIFQLNSNDQQLGAQSVADLPIKEGAYKPTFEQAEFGEPKDEIDQNAIMIKPKSGTRKRLTI